jgi:hypothetical protein
MAEPDYVERWLQAGGSLHHPERVTNPDYYKTIHGWFDFENVYDMAVAEAPDDGIFVEVGSWHGKSTAYLASRVALARKHIVVYAVDVWLGYRKGAPVSQFPSFLGNMVLANVIDIVIPLRMTSQRATRLFQDEGVDFCFIDAEHTYEAVRDDLAYWFPKVRPGGLFAGHDYHDEFPGVKKAVDEFFPKPVTVIGRSWLVHKES